MLVFGLALVLLVAALSAVVWAWAVRKPAAAPGASPDTEEAVPGPRAPWYVAIGDTDVNMLFGKEPLPQEQGWAALLHSMMPPDTMFDVRGTEVRTLARVNATALTAVVELQPQLITLWSVIGDSTGGTSLSSYLGELRTALNTLTNETEAQVVLLNLPDLTVALPDQPEERKALVRGGIEQWNRVIEGAAVHYGRRVLLVDLYPISEQVLAPRTGNAVLAETLWQRIQAEGVQSVGADAD